MRQAEQKQEADIEFAHRPHLRSMLTGAGMSEMTLKAFEQQLVGTPAFALCSEVRGLQRLLKTEEASVADSFNERMHLAAEVRRLERRLRRVQEEDIEDATNPVCSPEAAEDARQTLVEESGAWRCAACQGSGKVSIKNCAQEHLTLTCGHCNGSGRLPYAPETENAKPTPEQREILKLGLTPEEFERRFPRPRTGGVLPSPGREATKARREVAELREEMDARLEAVAELLTRHTFVLEALRRELDALMARLEAGDG